MRSESWLAAADDARVALVDAEGKEVACCNL